MLKAQVSSDPGPDGMCRFGNFEILFCAVASGSVTLETAKVPVV